MGVSQKMCKRPRLIFQQRESLSLSWQKIESGAMISCQFLVRIVQRFSASATADPATSHTTSTTAIVANIGPQKTLPIHTPSFCL